MTNDVMLALVIAECLPRVKDCEGGIEDKLRAAMTVAKDHWMVLDKETQFRGALAAVMENYGQGSDEWIRLEHEIKALARITAFIAAAEAGLSPSLPENDEETPKPIGVMKIWHEVTAQKGIEAK